MKKLKSPLTQLALVAIAIGGLYGLSNSPNVWLWTVCLLAIPVLVFLIGGQNATPVLLFIMGFSWLQIAAIVAVADIRGIPVANINYVYQSFIASPYVPRAIMYSLAAMVVVALGIRVGERAGLMMFHPARGRPSALELQQLSLSRALTGYGLAAPLATLAGVLAAKFPEFAQALIVLTLFKFVFVYLVVTIVFETRKGYPWLILVTLFEVASGALAFFSQFKEAIFIIVIAIVASRRRLNATQWIFGVVAVCGVVWMSLVWTEIKKDYRNVVWSMSFDQKVDYIAGKYLDSDIDYATATSRLLERIQYTGLFSKAIELADAGMLPSTHYYEDAVVHVIEPRFLFPNKAALDDSAETTKLIGLRIAKGTSMGVGYVTEAYADFGFPKLLLPMFAIGVLLGLAAKYFMTRPAPLMLREAFVTAALFTCFSFEANTGKNLGTFLMHWVVLALVLRFVAPLVSARLSRAPEVSATGMAVSGPPQVAAQEWRP